MGGSLSTESRSSSTYGTVHTVPGTLEVCLRLYRIGRYLQKLLEGHLLLSPCPVGTTSHKQQTGCTVRYGTRARHNSRTVPNLGTPSGTDCRTCTGGSGCTPGPQMGWRPSWAASRTRCCCCCDLFERSCHIRSGIW